MRNLESRLRKLETRGSGESGRVSLQLVVMPAGSAFGENFERTGNALNRCGFAQARGLVVLDEGPTGLRADEWEQFRHAYEEEV